MGNASAPGYIVDVRAVVVRGRVIGSVFFEAPEEVLANSVCVMFYASEHTAIRLLDPGEGPYRLRGILRSSKKRLQVRETLARFTAGRIPAGSHEFPFSLSLAHLTADDVAGPFFEGSEEGRCVLEYYVQAWVSTSAVKEASESNSHRVPIHLSRLAHTFEPKEVGEQVERLVVPLKRCCCLSRGMVHLAVAVNQDLYLAGQPIQVAFEVHNETQEHIEAVFVSVVQTTLFTADASKRSVLSRESLEVPWSRLEPGQQRSFDEGKTEIEVPRSFKGSYIGTVIQCRHSVEISLQTAIPWWTPTVSVAIHVVNPDRRVGPQRSVSGTALTGAAPFHLASADLDGWVSCPPRPKGPSRKNMGTRVVRIAPDCERAKTTWGAVKIAHRLNGDKWGRNDM